MPALLRHPATRDAGLMREVDVFGRRLMVERSRDGWMLFHPTREGKRRRVHNVIVPDSVETDDDLLLYLADLWHEAATPEKSAVRWID